VAVAPKPEVIVQPFVQGTTAVVSETSKAVQQSSTGSTLGYIGLLLLFGILMMFAMSIIFRHRGIYRIVPLVIIGLLLCCGVAEAGTLPVITAPVIKPFIDVIGWVIIVAITVFTL
jgi:hypothetical protein